MKNITKVDISTSAGTAADSSKKVDCTSVRQNGTKPNVVRRLSSAEKMGLDKIAIKDLQSGDMFSFDGEKIFIFSRVKEVIGCGLVTIHYLSTKRWASFDRMIKETKLVYAAPYGRFYKG